MPCSNLRAEMARKKISIEEMADFLGIHRNSVANKINGSSSFSIEESVKIQEKYFPELGLKYLFSRDQHPDMGCVGARLSPPFKRRIRGPYLCYIKKEGRTL